jgi:hypothetical protein
MKIPKSTREQAAPVLSDGIRATCREFFGRNVKRGGHTQLVDNRCEQCPLRRPCQTFCAAPARTFDELYEAREVFNAAAASLLDGAA